MKWFANLLRYHRPLWMLGIGCLLCCASTGLAQKDKSAESTESPLYGPLAQAPRKARARTNPFEGNAQEAEAGGKLFEQHCAECHGTKAGGTKHGPSLLQEDVQQATPGAVFWVITNGVVRRGMPVWSKLPEEQRWQIVTFVKSLTAHPVGSTENH